MLEVVEAGDDVGVGGQVYPALQVLVRRGALQGKVLLVVLVVSYERLICQYLLDLNNNKNGKKAVS